jgi:DNA-binding winged helix-turn-helix (wHTH) protein
METILIDIKSNEDKQLFLSLARRLRLKTKSLTESDKEDFGLLKAMLEGETGEYVSREELMKTLKV